MERHADVLVIGGGVIGLTTAYFLARDGIRVRLLEQGFLGKEASWAGAGIVPPGDPDCAETPFDRLRSLSFSLFPRLSEELRTATGVDNGFFRCGGLDFPGASEDLDEEWHGKGVTRSTLDAAAARSLEPALAPDLGPAVHLPDLCQLRNPRHLRALAEACRHLGADLREDEKVERFDHQHGRIQAAVSSSGTWTADRFLLAGGAWTDALLQATGRPAGIRPVRGQIVLLNPGRPLLHHVLLHGSRYLVPRPDGRILVGSTEEDVGFDRRTTAGGVASLLALATRLVPSLRHAEVERTWAGLRPGSPDGMPFLGPVPGWDNLFVAAGHFRAGIQLSPGTALLMKQRMMGQPTSLPLEPYGLERNVEAPSDHPRHPARRE